MMNCIANNKDWQMEAQKDTNNWGFLGSCSDYESAAVSFKLSKSWDQAGSSYVKLTERHLKMGSTHQAAATYVNGAHCYKKISPIRGMKVKAGRDESSPYAAIQILGRISECSTNKSTLTTNLLLLLERPVVRNGNSCLMLRRLLLYRRLRRGNLIMKRA